MSKDQKGILLVNLGSPDSTDPKDVKKYLREFLMDERVLDIPYWKRKLILELFILPTRPKKSAKAYQSIWWDEGSPLIVISENLKKRVEDKLDFPVALGMRYGSGNIKEGIAELHQQGVKEILLVPLYPQYAMSTFETVVVKAFEEAGTDFPDVNLSIINPFYNHRDYIKALSQSIEDGLDGFEYDHLLFTYHGVPERHIFKSDITKSHCKINGECCKAEPSSQAHQVCYRHQCYESTRLVTEHMNIPVDNYSQSFQSRLGRQVWLRPYTDDTLKALAEKGVKKLAVACPAFVSDCLETLEEIGMEGKEEFLAHGGEEFKLIPCMNDHEAWVDVLVKWANEWAKQN